MDAATGDDSEFVTVADASQRLQIALRTAQRYAAKLAQSDTTLAPGGAVRLVRLSSMAQQAEKAKRNQPLSASETGATLADGDRLVAQGGTTRDTNEAQSDTTAARDAKASKTTAEAVNDALVAQLQAENAHLRADLDYMKGALDKEQETSRALVGELTRANERAAVMIAATATGQMKQINATTPASTAAEPGTDADMSELPKASAHENASGDSVNDTTGSQTRAGWFARLLGRGGK